MNYCDAFDLCHKGFERWAAKPHNKKWVHLLDGTPIVNDILVNMATVINKADKAIED